MTDIKYKILIIDDDQNLSNMYGFEFSSHGFEVGQAFNANEALAKIGEGFVPNIILLDIIMPGANGIELLGKLCKDEKLKETKIILFSNLDQKADMDDDIRSKIVDYFLKVDMTPPQIRAKVNQVLGIAG